MFTYYAKLAIRQIVKTPAMSGLTVLTLAIGFSVFAMMLVMVVLSGRNPLPEKRGEVFTVHIDSALQPDAWAATGGPGDVPTLLSFPVAKDVLRSPIPRYQAAMFGNSMVLEPADATIAPFEISARVTGGDFFPMFNVPFAYGGRWEKSADDNAERVVVLSHEMNEKLFAGGNSVGKSIRLNTEDYRVVGVLSPWRPLPRFYALEGGIFAHDDLFLPYGLTSHLIHKLGPTGRVSSFERVGSFIDQMNAEVTLWQTFWVELPTAQQQAAYHDWLDAYVQNKKTQGLFPNPLNNRLLTVDQWLQLYGVVSSQSRSILWLAGLFYALCLVNSAGQLLARFLARSNEASVRRALGASRRQLLLQFLIEGGVLAVIATVLGLLLTSVGLLGLNQIFPGSQAVARFDPVVLSLAGAGLIVSVLCVSLYPIWHTTQSALASQLKIN